MWVKRIIYVIKNDFFSSENAALTIAVIVCLLLTANSITSMSRNWELSERLAKEKKELELIEIEIETLELENDYYKTEEYQELAARKLANKKLPGENLVYLPPSSEAAKKKHKTSTTETKQKEYSNFDKWMKFLFH